MSALPLSHLAPAPTPTVEMVDVTPELAKRWLEQNKRNRIVRAALVNAYSRDMAAGRWMLTGEAIKFDTAGNLSDGQHRLLAVVKAGVTVRMLVIRGIEPDAQYVMDTGAKRTAGDALGLVGVKYGAIVAAASSLALREPGAGFVRPESAIGKPTHAEIAEFVERHPEVTTAAEIVSGFYPSFDVAPSVLALCWMRFSAIDSTACREFFVSVANMQTDGPGDPRLALIRRLANARRSREHVSQHNALSFVFRTWNAWRKGSSLVKLQSDSAHGAVKIPEKLL